MFPPGTGWKDASNDTDKEGFPVLRSWVEKDEFSQQEQRARVKAAMSDMAQGGAAVVKS